MKIRWKIVYIKCTNSPELVRNLIYLKYKIMKIQWEIVYIRSTDHLDLKKKKKKSNSLNVQIHGNSMENQWTYQIVKLHWKIVYIRCTNSLDLLINLILLSTKLWKFKGKLCRLDVQIVQICLKIRIHWMYKIIKIQ